MGKCLQRKAVKFFFRLDFENFCRVFFYVHHFSCETCYAVHYCSSLSWLINVWSFHRAGTLFCPPSLPLLSIHLTKVLSLSCSILRHCIVASPALFAS